MQHFFLEYYLWVKALHIIAVIAWMAGLLYLPRLFVYHAEARSGSDSAIMLGIMERRLLRYIMNPASFAVWIFGLLMLYANPALLGEGWMHAKLGCVVLMTGLHHVFARWARKFAKDENKRPAKFYRIMNEIPTALMIVIVIMAVAEPF